MFRVTYSIFLVLELFFFIAMHKPRCSRRIVRMTCCGVELRLWNVRSHNCRQMEDMPLEYTAVDPVDYTLRDAYIPCFCVADDSELGGFLPSFVFPPGSHSGSSVDSDSGMVPQTQPEAAPKAEPKAKAQGRRKRNRGK